MLWFFTGCISYSSSSISSFYQRTHSFIFNSLSTLYSFFSLIHYRCEWINTTLWINSSSYHWIIKWVCYYCKDIFKYTIWRHSTTFHSSLYLFLKRILLFLYSISFFSFIVAFFGLSSEDCEICTICIRLYSLSSSLCHQDIIHALCGCCRDGHSLSFSSLIETARCLIYEQLGIQAFLHELQSYSLSSSVLSSVLVILTSFLCDSTLAIDLIPSFTISPSILSTVQQDHSFIEVWSNYILSKQTRCIFSSFYVYLSSSSNNHLSRNTNSRILFHSLFITSRNDL